jgi:hypothetical protein
MQVSALRGTNAEIETSSKRARSCGNEKWELCPFAHLPIKGYARI